MGGNPASSSDAFNVGLLSTETWHLPEHLKKKLFINNRTHYVTPLKNILYITNMAGQQTFSKYYGYRAKGGSTLPGHLI